MMDRSFVICRCNTVYTRSIEYLPTHECDAFVCDCGAQLGAWNGMLALRYQRVDDADARVLAKARRIGAAQKTTAAA